jgi:glycosidase
MAAAFDPPGLAGVARRLDALRALGVNTVWLSPLAQTAPADFGYAVTDHFALRSDAGGEADLRALVAAAHARSMRVILDFVPNHLSDRHPYYVDASRHGRASPYFDFFERTASGDAAHYFDWISLKNLNYANPEVRRMMIEAFAHWVRTFDIDGFRVDAAWGPRQRAPDFWPQWRRELKRIKPELLLLAEASARDPYYAANGFDAAYDWTDQLGVWAWAEAFAEPREIAGRLRRALAAGGKAGELPVFRFLNNNDTGARFVTRHGAARTRVASAMLLTLPGIPGLYTGDEVGSQFEPYNQRGAISWTDTHGLLAWYAGLLLLRHDAPALRSRGLRVLDLPDASQVLGYIRPGGTARDGILVLLNYGAEPTDVLLPEGALAELGAAGDTLHDLLEESAVRPDGRAIRLAGHGVRILQSRSVATAAPAR